MVRLSAIGVETACTLATAHVRGQRLPRMPTPHAKSFTRHKVYYLIYVELRRQRRLLHTLLPQPFTGVASADRLVHVRDFYAAA